MSLLFQFQNIFENPPLSVHQGAQADRASIALNYAQVSMNFFKPRVMELNTTDGITPVEFPIVNYTVAILYQVFGYHPFIYRFLMWLIMGWGLWAVFDLLFFYLKHLTSALLLSLAWYCGPILVFYTPNFIPDTASLALMMLALRLWVKHPSTFTFKTGCWFAFFAGLSCLIKISSGIFVIAILIAEVLNYKKFRPGILWACISVFMMVFSWYYYCQWLQNQVRGSYFTMNMVLAGSYSEFKEWLHIYYHNWLHNVYNSAQWIFILGGILSVPFLKGERNLKVLAMVSLSGCLAFYLLMQGQFRYHDYYIIPLLPVSLCLMILCFRWMYGFMPRLALTGLFAVTLWGFIDAKNNLRQRYTPGDYWYQTFFEPKDFEGVDDWLTQNGLDQNQKTVAAFDLNPNTMLYFLNRRGSRVNDHDSSFVAGKLALHKFLVTDDTARFFSQYSGFRSQLSLVSSHHRLSLYKSR